MATHVVSFAFAALIALSVSTTACAPSSQDAQDAMMTLSATEGVPGSDVWRLLYQGCSEIKRCADGCAKEMSMCADRTTDESQCATLLASCSRDARKAGADGVVGRAWFASHYGKFLDEVRPKVKEEDRAHFDKARAALQLEKVAAMKVRRP